MTLSHGQGHFKWCYMVEVNGAYQHSTDERILMKSLLLLPIDKVFALQDRQTDRHKGGQAMKGKMAG